MRPPTTGVYFSSISGSVQVTRFSQMQCISVRVRCCAVAMVSRLRGFELGHTSGRLGCLFVFDTDTSFYYMLRVKGGIPLSSTLQHKKKKQQIRVYLPR